MEWGNAKKLVIVILVVLNAALAFLNFQQRQDSGLSSAQEKAVFQVLADNGITLYTDIPSGTEAVSRLQAEVPSYTKEEIEQFFFWGEKTTVTVGERNRTFRTAKRVLIWNDGSGELEFLNTAEGNNLDYDEAVEVADVYLAGMKPVWGELMLGDTMQGDDQWELLYYGTYKDMPVYSNWVKLKITDGGVASVTFAYHNVCGAFGDEQQILLGDEILLSFMREWKKDESHTQTAIGNMELGYGYTDASLQQKGSVYYLEPCYCLYLMGDDPAYFISAYTGKVLSGDWALYKEVAEYDTGNTGDTQVGDIEAGDAEIGNTEAGDTDTGDAENTEAGGTEAGSTEAGDSDVENTDADNTETGDIEDNNNDEKDVAP